MRNRERTRDGGARIQFICHRCVFTKCEIAHTRLTYQCLVAGGMDFRAMLMRKKKPAKKVVVVSNRKDNLINVINSLVLIFHKIVLISKYFSSGVLN